MRGRYCLRCGDETDRAPFCDECLSITTKPEPAPTYSARNIRELEDKLDLILRLNRVGK